MTVLTKWRLKKHRIWCPFLNFDDWQEFVLQEVSSISKIKVEKVDIKVHSSQEDLSFFSNEYYSPFINLFEMICWFESGIRGLYCILITLWRTMKISPDVYFRDENGWTQSREACDSRRVVTRAISSKYGAELLQEGISFGELKVTNMSPPKPGQVSNKKSPINYSKYICNKLSPFEKERRRGNDSR